MCADIYFLIRYLLDLIHLSVTLKLELANLPESKDQFELFRMYSDEMSIQMNCEGVLLTVTLRTADGATTTLRTDISRAGWTAGKRVTLSVTYDAHEKVVKLLFDTTVMDSKSDCRHGYINASLLQPEVRDNRHKDFMPIQFILLHARVIQPDELQNVDSILRPSD